MNITIIGAGMGGLSAARFLADGGVSVRVYEKSKKDELSYDWTDDAQDSVFKDLGIPLPEGKCYRGEAAALVAPFSDKPLQVPNVPYEQRDWTVDRRALASILCDLAESAGAEIIFDTPADSLIIENGAVKGINIGSEKIYSDLVIDSSGALSPFRAGLPAEFRITPEPAPDEVFHVFRAFYDCREGAEKPVFPKKVYLKHLGEMGISWCMIEPTGYANVLVGRTSRLSDEALEKALQALREENPIIGDTLLRGGTVATIPIRHALSRFCGKGYAAVGDAAFMTIPMIGSGIAHSLRAGKMLADAILRDKSVSEKTLWSYQVQYYKEIGSEDFTVDKIKRMLLSTDSADIKYLFDHGVINENDMASISGGTAMVMTPKMILEKVRRGFFKLGVLLRLKNAIADGEKAGALAKAIPENYNEAEIDAWQKKIDSLF